MLVVEGGGVSLDSSAHASVCLHWRRERCVLTVCFFAKANHLSPQKHKNEYFVVSILEIFFHHAVEEA